MMNTLVAQHAVSLNPNFSIMPKVYTVISIIATLYCVLAYLEELQTLKTPHICLLPTPEPNV